MRTTPVRPVRRTTVGSTYIPKPTPIAPTIPVEKMHTYQTVREYIAMAPECLKPYFVGNRITGASDTVCDFAEAVNAAFTWDNTLQGSEFWSTIHNGLNAGKTVESVIETAKTRLIKMQSVKEYFDSAPDCLKPYITGKKEYRPWATTIVKDFSTALSTGIDWSSTSEGQIFWNKVYNVVRTDPGQLEATINFLKDVVEFNKRFVQMPTAGVYNVTPDGGKISGQITVLFHNGIFGNCQNFQVGYMEGILAHFKPESVPKVASYFKTLAGGKKIMMVDIHQSHVSQLKAIFPNIIMESNYNSTNGSKMCIVLINVEKIISMS